MMEPLWMAAPDHSAEKVFFQLVIQIANACLKKRMARDKAHDRLCAISLDLADDLARRGDSHGLWCSCASIIAIYYINMVILCNIGTIIQKSSLPGDRFAVRLGQVKEGHPK